MKKSPLPDPAIRCSHSAVEDPQRLKINPRNPNKHGDSQLRLYAKILRHQGWRKPVVVSHLSGMVVTGAGAVLCARAEGWGSIPVDRQDFASEADEYAHLLADNNLPQLSELDQAAMDELMRDEIKGKLDEELAGLSLEGQPEVELKKVEVKAPPKMAWVLIGIPLVRFSEINEALERIADLEDTIVESTVNDATGKLTL